MSCRHFPLISGHYETRSKNGKSGQMKGQVYYYLSLWNGNLKLKLWVLHISTARKVTDKKQFKFPFSINESVRNNIPSKPIRGMMPPRNLRNEKSVTVAAQSRDVSRRRWEPYPSGERDSVFIFIRYSQVTETNLAAKLQDQSTCAPTHCSQLEHSNVYWWRRRSSEVQGSRVQRAAKWIF
jgi:hypothetical protein